MTRTLADLVPFPLAVSGRHGYWGASPMLEVLTHPLRDARERQQAFSESEVAPALGGRVLP